MIKIENSKKKMILKFVDCIMKPLFTPFKSAPSNIRFNKILLIRLDHVGDIAILTPIPRLLKKTYPDCNITILIGSWARDLIKHNPYIDEIISHDVPWWSFVKRGTKKKNFFKYIIKDYLPLLKKLKNEQFDLGIDFRGDIRQIFLFLFLPRIKYRLSYDRSGGEYLLTKTASYNNNEHETEKNMNLLKKINVKAEFSKPEIHVTKKERDYIDYLFKTKNIDESELKIVLSPGARVKVKCWPMQDFLELGKSLIQKYNAWVIFTGTSSEIIIEKIPDHEKFINLIDKTNLLQLTALFERANLLISNDSGATHIASSRNLPIITLFGPTEPKLYRPISDKNTVIKKDFVCSPCLHRTCEAYKTENGKCMEEITVGDVMQEVDKIL